MTHRQPTAAPAEPEIAAWADARIADVLSREYEQSLELSRHKPLGSMGYTGIWPLLRGLWARRRHFRQRGRLLAVAPPGVWIYEWHPRGLQSVLYRHRHTLWSHDWPIEPEAFVTQARNEPVAPCTPLYDVIADAYGDELNPGRTDVMPDVPRVRLLDALFPFVDPSIIYFELFPDALTCVPSELP